ncbi:hypothetical protein BT96DRAFT_996731 [Gymnopus androsaceus JB14]|uniref:Uncharacterized protein n=1 Tax=Gymnopus androsaceus JB14 TaxID=1447944 RepID=A0A6A4HH13_9AGAR|nr:hypothetical protein BT96DRAFT_996731 [Gymnopus androsaceus JB14]
MTTEHGQRKTILVAAQVQAAGQCFSEYASRTRSMKIGKSPRVQVNSSNGVAVSTVLQSPHPTPLCFLHYILRPIASKPSVIFYQTFLAFSSYGASETDLLSLDFGFPGIGVSLPDGGNGLGFGGGTGDDNG